MEVESRGRAASPICLSLFADLPERFKTTGSASALAPLSSCNHVIVEAEPAPEPE